MPARAYNEAKAFVDAGARGRLAVAREADLGRRRPVGPEPRLLRLVRRADLNYYTALSYARPGEDLTDRYWPAQMHVIGKDIVKFHAIYWPAMLLAAGLALPEHVFVARLPDGRRTAAR